MDNNFKNRRSARSSYSDSDPRLTYGVVLFLLTLGLVAADSFMTVKATGDVRCLFVKCVVVK